MGDKCTLVEAKIKALIEEAKEKGFDEFEVKPTTWMHEPWFRLHWKFKNVKGYFDVSQATFKVCENRIILKEISRDLRL
ncbi:MAG: hypothetical protein J6S85_15815 [Methanobrevibacter sp.]|nr:hypothetical protein [Methanobrevibacter sp.]